MNTQLKRLRERISATKEMIALNEQVAREHPESPSLLTSIPTYRRRLEQLEDELVELTTSSAVRAEANSVLVSAN